jgi:hypothetical protein
MVVVGADNLVSGRDSGGDSKLQLVVGWGLPEEEDQKGWEPSTFFAKSFFVLGFLCRVHWVVIHSVVFLSYTSMLFKKMTDVVFL